VCLFTKKRTHTDTHTQTNTRTHTHKHTHTHPHTHPHPQLTHVQTPQIPAEFARTRIFLTRSLQLCSFSFTITNVSAHVLHCVAVRVAKCVAMCVAVCCSVRWSVCWSAFCNVCCSVCCSSCCTARCSVLYLEKRPTVHHHHRYDDDGAPSTLYLHLLPYTYIHTNTHTFVNE